MADKKPFADALQTIKDAVVDFSQLNVRTFVGTIDVSFDGNGNPEWNRLLENALSNGKIKLVASTTLFIDGDADNFEDTDSMTPGLREAHQNAIKAGQDSRAAMLELIKGKIGTLIKSD
jgi:hypothetical protein